ncbi:MAG: preprotein translocase subunit SecA [Parcubacteria group bacterium LiPW_39]|nr:MAG: preprotein translocase subunit SecA [Parcubacteria group bacterium LiPW_39]
MSFLTKIFGDSGSRVAEKYQPVVELINQLEPQFEAFSAEELRAKTQEFKERLAKGEMLDDLLPEVFAAVREAAKRTIGQRHFDVQLIGGMVLHEGRIAEMKTGEGKTLAATLAVYLNALEGKGVHVVTVNDYLSKRDANWMGAIYHALGLTVGCIQHEVSYVYEPKAIDKNEVTIEMENLRQVPRREAYAVDITYGTNNEFGFDYLRDNMVESLDQMVQTRGTRRNNSPPSGETRNRAEHYLNYAIVDEVDSILIDEARTPLIISAPDMESTKLYETFAKIVPHLKENVDYNIDEKMRTSILTEAGIEKVEKILGLGNIYTEGGVRYVHHLEQALRAQALFKRDRDYVVKNGEIIIVDEFTGRLMPGRRYSEGLHQALEAKEGVQVQKESRTLATITFQNYFRMYKKLAGMTGTALTSAEEMSKVYKLEVVAVPTNKPMIRVDLPDGVYRTEQGKFMAVIREIQQRHKVGQPVLVGTVSIQKNELLSELLKREGIPHELLNAKNHEREAQIIAQAGEKGAVTIATNMAGRGVDIILGGRSLPEAGARQVVSENAENPQRGFSASASSSLSADKVDGAVPARRLMVSETTLPRSLDEQWQAEHDKVVALGGLHIIGTERHEARRIDDQLRGRAGRQGDPGSSQFFVSLEDDLMRIFAPDKIKRMMEILQVPEDQPIENKMISRAIESAQAKIEGFNFDIRKHVLEYDDVMNKQRETIYRKRREILASTNLKEQVLEIISQEIAKVIKFHTPGEFRDDWNYEEIYENLNTIFPVPGEARQNMADAKNRDDLIDYVIGLAKKAYEEKAKQLGGEQMRQIEKFVYLRTIDTLWMDHLDEMEHLRDSVRLRAYGQKDPLVEYKNEGHRLFGRLLGIIQANFVGMIYKVALAPQAPAPPIVYHQPSTAGPKQPIAGSRSAVSKKIGRNDPCPCGAKHPDGRPIKYKHCHGRSI